ncbi:NRDE family protein [Aestuariibacter halophilus]|uniref:NRDE family protein n=1 Tax=Fluctibacter halophilus TaxID=226011 RepID=A0ABS8G5D6_9ALTE|nr:NRDE family protein [Aestuariibacter halophilus]MCC2615770.1 NRDE family protein [Aestuariibacter halophilus]
MCILFIAVKQHPDLPLIIAANRDEFYQRPTTPSGFWNEYPSILAGKDRQAGGTWMGVTRGGKIAALTNVREPQRVLDNAPSRGELTVNYLTEDVSTSDYLQCCQSSRQHYNGYNLLFGEWHNLHVYNNRSDTLTVLKPGFYALSNASIDMHWPKQRRGVKGLQAACQLPADHIVDALLTVLQDDHQAPEEALPDTGIPKDWERLLSSIFITTPDYGTRCSTILTVDDQQHISWYEQTYQNGHPSSPPRTFQFAIG